MVEIGVIQKVRTLKFANIPPPYSTCSFRTYKEDPHPPSCVLSAFFYVDIAVKYSQN